MKPARPGYRNDPTTHQWVPLAAPAKPAAKPAPETAQKD